ncbi:DUF4148 domain-containing protein [Paraburkholderia adhaesiva]|uniref:DUF4148 domain-containing protein n=1 Tax=Paraburkholderia adhaesiva TaxID=2883244 RepID=UPI001F241E27|nr:DUF4148 domain-containing protein [Paraburkholderia adhaesiva]
MKSLINAVIVVAVLAAPAITFAQPNQPLTRAEVREELVQLEKSGYNPRDDVHYPANLQRAEAILAEQKNGVTAYGPDEQGGSQSGK